jgi:phosphopantothenoylcysteine synthetase/decarboxylase
MHFLITAGGTREYIDPVRFITNASSGKMGYALAQAAVNAGHKVTLITAPTNLKVPEGIKVVNVETAAQMFEAVKTRLPNVDCLIMAAAVADYTPLYPTKSKMKKTGKIKTIKLKPTEDILKWAGKNKKEGQLIVGFALEDKEVRERAEKKMKNKHLDMIVANTPDAIAADRSTVHIKTPHSDWKTLEHADKAAVAKEIIAFSEALTT